MTGLRPEQRSGVYFLDGRLSLAQLSSTRHRALCTLRHRLPGAALYRSAARHRWRVWARDWSSSSLSSLPP